MYRLAADMSWPLGHLVCEAFFFLSRKFSSIAIHLGRSNHQGSSFFLAVEGEEVNFDSDSFLTVSKSRPLAQLKKHVYFCMCDSGVPVISCFHNYIVRVTAASLLHVQGLWTVSRVPTAIIHLLIASSLAQDRYSETLSHIHIT